MLKSGYWMTEYLSISSVLKRAPANYVTAYLHAESDGQDRSYFVSHQLLVIEEAVSSLRAYLARKVREGKQAEEGHQAAHRVAYPTARSDLLGLEALGLLSKQTSGKSFVFAPAPDLSRRLERR